MMNVQCCVRQWNTVKQTALGSYLKYCNGAETFYTYDNRRRLSNLAVNSGITSIMDNDYTFDAVSNVLSVTNNASLPQSGNAGGQMPQLHLFHLCLLEQQR